MWDIKQNKLSLKNYIQVRQKKDIVFAIKSIYKKIINYENVKDRRKRGKNV